MVHGIRQNTVSARRAPVWQGAGRFFRVVCAAREWPVLSAKMALLWLYLLCIYSNLGKRAGNPGNWGK